MNLYASQAARVRFGRVQNDGTELNTVAVAGILRHSEDTARK